jgi:hypothetical protein
LSHRCIILAILETDGRTQATAALGRIVIDMAEFAGIEHQETRTFAVTCNKSIHATVGEPQLTVTVRWGGRSVTHHVLVLCPHILCCVAPCCTAPCCAVPCFAVPTCAALRLHCSVLTSQPRKVTVRWSMRQWFR